MYRAIEMKKCFKCGETKPLADYYKHSQMADGHLNKCKECTKNDSTGHRNNNLEKIRAYDRDRGCRQSLKYRQKYKEEKPNASKARYMVGNAVRDKKLFRLPCEVCGTTEKIHGHHDDYLKPLNVRWLCCAHHKQWHRDNGEGLNP